MEYETVIGLEVHVQLRTKTKTFCGCPTEFGKEPNTQVCPVCLGLPGSLPVLNKVALDYAIKAGLALHCSVHEYIKFDRKHYYYPDLPKNFQISQYDLPVSKEGFLDIELEGKTRRIRIKRVHLEEDAGKLMHREESSVLDFNRTGVPLLEIVSEPDINSPQEAYEYLTVLKSIVEYLGISDCDMEKGSLRCDANISLKERGASKLGTKSELKNMNSFKGVREALGFEIRRQAELLNEGLPVIQETRLWDVKELKTFPMRTKEEAMDYRYFPEPDLPPFIIHWNKITEIRESIPELPKEKKARFMREYGLSEYDTGILVSSKEYADITEAWIKAYPGKDKKPIVNWAIGPILEAASNLKCSPVQLKIPGGSHELIMLVEAVEDGRISNLIAKSVFNESVTTGVACSTVIKEKNLIQISDNDTLDTYVTEIIKENPKSVEDFRIGKVNALMFLVGQVMRKTEGKANPKAVQEILKRRLTHA